MLNPKLSIYRIEWLDLVFENRNKNYGAYELRLKYPRTMVKALLIASFFFAGVIIAISVYSLTGKGNPVILSKMEDDGQVTMTDVVLPPQKKLPPAEQQTSLTVKVPKVQTTKFLPPKVVASSLITEDIPTIADLKESLIGAVNTEGKLAAANASLPEISSGSEGTDEGKIFIAVERSPQFHGGLKEFYKYLSRNLRYPSQAIENEISGRVVVSFVVEKNGELSNIKILKGIGFGCDEEAVRVLKHSPLWEPGEQNGRKVRVQFTMPLLFSLSGRW